jgi:hypothetical protein
VKAFARATPHLSLTLKQTVVHKLLATSASPLPDNGTVYHNMSPRHLHDIPELGRRALNTSHSAPPPKRHRTHTTVEVKGQGAPPSPPSFLEPHADVRWHHLRTTMAQLAMSSPPEQGLPRHRAGEPSPVAAHARDATTRAIAPAATASSSTTPAAIAPPTVATAAANQTPATVLGPPHRAPPKKHAPPPYRHWIRPWPRWIHALHLLPP